MRLLNTEQTAHMLGVQPKTLEVWRWRGYGPAFRKVGHLVRYAEEEVLEWLDGRLHQNTGQYRPPAG